MIIWTKFLASGSAYGVEPADGKKFTLKEMQDHVGGYIERVSLGGNDEMWVNEEGLLKGLPLNQKATALVRLRAPGFPGLIVGDVLVKCVTRNGGAK